MGIFPQWPRIHVSFPILTLIPSSPNGCFPSYLAKCANNDCKTFKGDTGNVWVKIEQLSYNPQGHPPWASDLLREQGAKWSVTIPPKLAPGEYLLRHEILGLHVAGTRMGAQFYPSCTQIRVTQGGTTQLPAGIALPGAYKPEDPGVSLLRTMYAGGGFEADRYSNRSWLSCGGFSRGRHNMWLLVGRFGVRLRRMPIGLGLKVCRKIGPGSLRKV